MLLQSTQFEIQKLEISSFDGQIKYDIRSIFEELNIFENVMMPCMSGNIVIKDGVGMTSKINFDGNEYLTIALTKDIDNPEIFNFTERKFAIYKQTDRKEINQNAEMYTLHFVSEEFILSSQKKIRQYYKGTYTDIVKAILSNHLNVQFATPQIGNMETSTGIKEWLVPNMSPFDAIEFVTKRAIGEEGLPDYLFWQSNYGYNFITLSQLFKLQDPRYIIKFGAKNLSEQTLLDEIVGARDFKVISQFNAAENIQYGVYAGKFIGFDTLTRTIKTTELNRESIHGIQSKHPNKYALNSSFRNKDSKKASEMYDSLVTVYPFQSKRFENGYLKGTDSSTANIIDDTDNYILQRKMIFGNLMQKKLRITIPGNFGLTAGSLVQLDVPHRYNEQNNTQGDKTLAGVYMISAVRHIIRYDKHETIIETVTDSTNYGE